MFISNKDLQTLIDCEDYLHEVLCEQTKGTDKFEEGYDLFCKYNTLIENLIQKKIKANKENWERIKVKRATDKSYARSKEEIRKHKCYRRDD